jgi:hypothetical protein
MRQFKQLQVGQFLCYAAAGALTGTPFSAHGPGEASLIVLGLSALLAAVGWIGPQIVHELFEINDQLAGRSKEFHAYLRDLASGRAPSDGR